MSAESTAAPKPAATPLAAPAMRWKRNLVLFLMTAASVFVTGITEMSERTPPKDEGTFESLRLTLTTANGSTLINAGAFATTILVILLCHEFGHYIAARIHKVDASLPFFIPAPILSPFGTMGAVIRMRGVIPTRRALLDIGAAGPLAGMAVALPLYAWGVSHSHVVPIDPTNGMELGESVLIRVFDRLFAPAVPDGMTLAYSPVAWAAWGGFFVTMINLLPVGQLDGGHIAYALFGPRQDAFARTAHRAMLVFFGVAIVGHLGRDLNAGRAVTAALVGRHIGNSLFWLVWFNVLGVLGTLSARAQAPETEDDDAPSRSLPIWTRVIGVVGLLVIASFAKDHPSWLMLAGFFAGLGLLVAMEIKSGVFRTPSLLDHPPTGPEPLGLGRKAVAIFTLLLFGLLFMPQPFSM